ncbi:SSI family serine proteinase inhibitor [Streptomyces celluloflavus]|uniref:SSI family serine proteinase inhibitor n=1 Tax=Streptomyces celluloflavus TaxID=58344 RepID=UPI003687DE95
MPHRRTSRHAVATAALSIVAAVSALVTTVPAASAAPIPLVPHRSAADAGPGATDGAGTGPVDEAWRGAVSAAGLGAGRLGRGTDHLTVTVTRSGTAKADGTFELYCHPHGGSHRAAARACDALDQQTSWGKDLFAPVPRGAKCTMMYGGPATAHVTGTWAGRPVNADFRRTNGCEIDRWNRFQPLLPVTAS